MMKKKSTFVLLMALAFALTLVGLPLGAIAQDQRSGWDAPENRVPGGAAYNHPPLPPEMGVPTGRPRGGANRGDCSDVSLPPLTALVPATPVPNRRSTSSSELNLVWAVTSSAHPTLWFYVPYALSETLPAEFVLLDDHQNYIYRVPLEAQNATPGILAVTLPESVPALEVGKPYQWYFMVYCSPSDPMFTSGWLQRTALSPALTRQLSSATALEQAKLYANNGIWHEALTTLAELRRTEPNNPAIATEWTELLRSADLEEIADQPILP